MGSAEYPDPRPGEYREPQPTQEYVAGEIVPAGYGPTQQIPTQNGPAQPGHPGIDVPVSSAPFPVQLPPPAPQNPDGPPPVLVKRRTLSVLLCLLLVLALAVVGLLYTTLNKGTKTLVVAGATSPSASPTDTAASDPSTPTAGPSSGGSPGTAPTNTAATADASPAATGTDGGALVVGPGGSSFAPPFGTQYLGEPIDAAGGVDTKTDVTISNVDYPDSTEFYCPTTGLDDWNVAGYSSFTATFGIPDDAQYATGITNTVTFSDQNGKTLGTATTSIGQPAKVSFPLTGVVRLIVNCARQGSNASSDNMVALGNASVSTLASN
ncbi:MAG TPA: hypothetical protein VGX23_02710 [Actinocrinis sp.]|nr:hypothetical protein [Actinocrinis sp.]